METASIITLNKLQIPTNLNLFWHNLADQAEVLQLAREAIDELRLSHPQSTPSNVQAVYMSPWKSHLLSAKFQPLADIAIRTAKQIAKEHLSTDLEALNLDLFVADCWAAVYEEEDHTLPHTHFPADFSVVTYLDADPGCAPIVFDDTISVQPVSGVMLLFPGLLKHSVPKNKGKRTVVAMNLYKIPTVIKNTTASA
jgi:hypothetical protein